MGALALSILGVGATGATLIGLGKGALLTAGVFTLAGGPVGTVIGLSVYAGVIGLGILATYIGHKIGQSKGERRAQNVKMNDAAVIAHQNSRIDKRLDKGEWPAGFEEALDESIREVERFTIDTLKMNLDVNDRAAIRNGMSQHLTDQLRYFKADFSVADARATLRKFGNCMAQEICGIRQAGDGGKGAARAYYSSQTCGMDLLNILVKTPPAKATEIARAQSQTLVHWNNYVQLTAKAGHPLKDSDAELERMLRNRDEYDSGDPDDYDSNVATSKTNDAISTALDPKKPARKLYEGAARLERALSSDTCFTARTCRQRNALLKHAFLAIAPDSTSRDALRETFGQLDSAISSQQGASPSRADKRVFLEAAPLAANRAAIRYMASLDPMQGLPLTLSSSQAN